MDVIPDVYGQEILSEYNDEDSYKIIEHYDGFFDISHQPPNFFADFDDWLDIEKKAIGYAKGDILDLNPGAGSIPIYLNDQGFKVTSIHSSYLANTVCRERGLKNSYLLSIDNIDQLDPDTFDTFIALGSHFGLFSSIFQSKNLLRELHQIANAGALFLIENSYPFFSDNPYGYEDQDLNKWSQNIPTQLQIRIRFKHYIGEWFNQLIISKKQLENIIEGTGWFIREIIESDSTEFIGVLEKSD